MTNQDNRKNLQSIARTVKRANISKDFALIFAECNSLEEQQKYLEELRQMCGKDGVLLTEVKLLEKPPTERLLMVIKDHLEKEFGDRLPEKMGIQVTGLELSILLDDDEQAPVVLQILNMNRESYYHDLPFPFIFWLPEYACIKVANAAPDFWSFRVGSAIFCADETPRSLLPESIESGKSLTVWQDKLAQIPVLERLLDTQPSPEVRVDLLIKSADAYYYLGKTEKAKQRYEQAVEENKDSNGDARRTAEAYNKLGLIYSDMGEDKKSLEKAVKSLQQYLKIVEQGDRTDLVTMGYNHLGLIYDKHKKYPQALQAYEKAQEISRRHGHRKLEGDVLGNIGLLYRKQENYEDALKMHDQALSISREMDDIQGEALDLSNIGLIYHEQNRHEKAIDYYNQALLNNVRIGNKLEEMNQLIHLGDAWKVLGDFSKSMEKYNSAKAIAENININIFTVLERQAALFGPGGIKDENQEILLLKEAIEKSRQLEMTDKELQYWQRLCEIYRKRNEITEKNNCLMRMEDLIKKQLQHLEDEDKIIGCYEKLSNIYEETDKEKELKTCKQKLEEISSQKIVVWFEPGTVVMENGNSVLQVGKPYMLNFQVVRTSPKYPLVYLGKIPSLKVPRKISNIVESPPLEPIEGRRISTGKSEPYIPDKKVGKISRKKGDTLHGKIGGNLKKPFIQSDIHTDKQDYHIHPGHQEQTGKIQSPPPSYISAPSEKTVSFHFKSPGISFDRPDIDVLLSDLNISEAGKVSITPKSSGIHRISVNVRIEMLGYKNAFDIPINAAQQLQPGERIDYLPINEANRYKVIAQKLDNEETGFKYFKNYDCNEDYKHHPKNWGIAQAKNGIIYVANQAGVLEFDGVSWRCIGIPEYASVRSLAIDESGTIYIGGNNKIGYLAPDSNETLKYVSLLDHLDDNFRNFSDVWRTHATKEGIYFSSYEFLFRWNPKRKQMKVWKPTHRFIYSFAIKGKLLIHQEKVGIMHMVNDSLELLPGGEIFADEKVIISMIVPYDNDSDTMTLLIRSGLTGFYLFNGKTVKPFPTEVDDYLKDNGLFHGIRLSSGDFALATRRGGLVIMDYNGRLKYIFDKTSGIQNDCVYYVLEDTQGNLWLCLDNGISKIEYASPFYIYDKRSDLPGIVLSVVRHNGDLYAGTTQGLHVLRSHSKAFRPVPGISSNCWSLLSIEDSILAATTDGVFQVDNKTNTKKIVNKYPSFALLISKQYPGRIWCGTTNGLVALVMKNSQWIEEYRLETIKLEIRSIAEDKNGNVWLCTIEGDTLKLDFHVNINHPDITRYDTSHRLFGRMNYVTWADGHVILAAEKGIFRFDDEKRIFIPDLTLGAKFVGGNLLPKPIFRLAEDKNKNIWFHSQSRNYQAIPGPDGSFTINSQPFRRLPIAQVNTIYPDPDGMIIWFGFFDSIIRYDTTVKKDYGKTFNTLIRRVLVNEKQKNEKQIFGGCVSKTGKKGKTPFPLIEYSDRNLYFKFAAPFFEAEDETQYRFFLDGNDVDWSKWDKLTWRNYTNLDPGLYSFRVQAKNVYEHVGVEGVFRFRVLPENTLKQIFISYSHSDSKFVNSLTRDLEKEGNRVWLDKKEIEVGDSISKKIEEGISKCDFFCLVISSYSANSNWVEREYRTALNAQLSSGTTPKILPLLIQDVESPLLLKDIKFADFSSGYKSGLKQLLKAIKKQ